MAELFGTRRRLLRRARRLDAHVRRRAALHGRLRDRRRQPADRRRHRARLRLPRAPTRSRCARSATAPPTRARSARRSTSPRCGGCRSSSWSPTTSSAWAPSLERHSAVTDLQRKGESLGVPGMRCDGMDVLDTYAVLVRGGRARARGAPPAARRGRHLPLPRPLDGRPRAVPHQGGGRAVARARPDPRLRRRLVARGRDRRASSTDRRGGVARVDAAVEFAEASPFPAPSRSTTTSTCSATSRAAGTRSTTAERAPTARSAMLRGDGTRSRSRCDALATRGRA